MKTFNEELSRAEANTAALCRDKEEAIRASAGTEILELELKRYESACEDLLATRNAEALQNASELAKLEVIYKPDERVEKFLAAGTLNELKARNNADVNQQISELKTEQTRLNKELKSQQDHAAAIAPAVTKLLESTKDTVEPMLRQKIADNEAAITTAKNERDEYNHRAQSIKGQRAARDKANADDAYWAEYLNNLRANLDFAGANEQLAKTQNYIKIMNQFGTAKVEDQVLAAAKTARTYSDSLRDRYASSAQNALSELRAYRAAVLTWRPL